MGEKAGDGFFGVTGHVGAPSNAEAAASQTVYLVARRPKCEEEARAAYWKLRKRADDAADGAPCDQIFFDGLLCWAISA